MVGCILKVFMELYACKLHWNVQLGCATLIYQISTLFWLFIVKKTRNKNYLFILGVHKWVKPSCNFFVIWFGPKVICMGWKTTYLYLSGLLQVSNNKLFTYPPLYLSIKQPHFLKLAKHEFYSWYKTTITWRHHNIYHDGKSKTSKYHQK